MKTVLRKPKLEILEKREMFYIRTTVPLTALPQNVKSGVDAAGAQYELSKKYGSDTGTLMRQAEGGTQFIESVNDFRINGNQVDIVFSDGSLVTTMVQGSIAESLILDAAKEQNVAPTNVAGIRGIVGNLSTERELTARFGGGAPRLLLDSVGRIDVYADTRDNFLDDKKISDPKNTYGSGTLLAYGDRRYVLTAAHVVERDNGARIPTTEMRYIVQYGSNLAEKMYAVKRVIGREYFKSDIALLELAERVDVGNIEGALLPDMGISPVIRQQILTVGYGLDAQNKFGVRKMGFTAIDAKPVYKEGQQKVDHFWALGEHLQFTFNAGEAATRRGDSGGPDIVPMKLNGTFLPVVVGVHSFGSTSDPRPDSGYKHESVALTDRIVQLIQKAIPYDFATSFRIGIRIIYDSDDNISGRGEWEENFQVNSTRIDLLPSSVSDGEVYWTNKMIAANGSQVKFSMSGKELDDGFFTGQDDPLPSYTKTFTIPSRVYRKTYSDRSGDLTVRDGGAYEMMWEVNRESVPVAKVGSFATMPLDSERPVSRSFWKNASRPSDIDNDGTVSPLDVLALVNVINQRGTGTLRAVESSFSVPLFVDVNGDERIDPLDVLAVINEINTGMQRAGTGDGEGVHADLFDEELYSRKRKQKSGG